MTCPRPHKKSVMEQTIESRSPMCQVTTLSAGSSFISNIPFPAIPSHHKPRFKSKTGHKLLEQHEADNGVHQGFDRVSTTVMAPSISAKSKLSFQKISL